MKKNGACVIISIGAWGGVYATRSSSSVRICLGWVALTFIPHDGDAVLELAARAIDLQKALSYYSAGLLDIAPAYVPKIIELPRTVRGEYPIGPRVIAKPGEYECTSNKWGAISVMTPSGHLLGIKPKEFEVVEWVENPKLEKEGEPCQ